MKLSPPLCEKILARTLYYDSWPLLDFFKMWDVPVFHSAGHINFVVWLLVALHPGKPWSSGGKCYFLPPRMLQQWTTTFCTSMHQSRGQTTHLYRLLL